jgi:hypothetical protein
MTITFQVSMIVGKKTLYLYNLNDPENPIELAFQVSLSYDCKAPLVCSY